MAHAVKELYPDAKLAIGPATAEGFYYDFDCDRTLTDNDLHAIEDKMKEIIRANKPFIKEVHSKKDAVGLFKSLGENYKVELLEEIEDDEIALYREDNFIDLCRGPHLKSTGKVKAFKLLSVAGAYWRGG